MIEHFTSPTESDTDRNNPLRPKRLADFIGQTRLKNNMKVFIQAALARNETLDHILLAGPPGLGKTTFAHIVGVEMNANVISTSAPIIEKPGDMAAILSSIKEKDILFIDEIHRLKPVVEEVLYSAMEDFNLDIQIGQGMTSQTVKIPLPQFTLIGATTKPGALTQPLLSRFGISGQYEFYSLEELIAITKNNAKLLNISIENSGLIEIASRSRGTPRILNRILKRVRDFAQIQNQLSIDAEFADYALSQMEIDKEGFDSQDRKILLKIIHDFDGGPVGLDNLAMSIGDDAQTIEEMTEPFLLQKGFIKRTPRGRIATRKAYQYFKVELPISHGVDDQIFFNSNNTDNKI